MAAGQPAAGQVVWHWPPPVVRPHHSASACPSSFARRSACHLTQARWIDCVCASVPCRQRCTMHPVLESPLLRTCSLRLAPQPRCGCRFRREALASPSITASWAPCVRWRLMRARLRCGRAWPRVRRRTTTPAEDGQCMQQITGALPRAAHIRPGASVEMRPVRLPAAAALVLPLSTCSQCRAAAAGAVRRSADRAGELASSQHDASAGSDAQPPLAGFYSKAYLCFAALSSDLYLVAGS